MEGWVTWLVMEPMGWVAVVMVELVAMGLWVMVDREAKPLKAGRDRRLELAIDSRRPQGRCGTIRQV